MGEVVELEIGQMGRGVVEASAQAERLSIVVMRSTSS